MATKNTFKDLLNALRNATKNAIKENQNSNVVIFLKNTVNKLDKILKTIDTILKKRNIDIGTMYEKAKNKSNVYLKRAKELATNVKKKGFLSTVKGAAENLKAKLGAVFKKSNETTAGPPEEANKENTNSFFNKMLLSINNKVNDIKEKITKVTDKKDKNKIEETSERKGFFDTLTKKYKERQDKRVKEIEEEKKAVRGKAKPKGKGWLSKILSGITTLGSFLLSGFKKALGFAAGFLTSGLSKTLFSLVPKLSSGIARAVSELFTGGLKNAGKLAWDSIKSGAKALLGRSGLVRTGAMTLGRSGLVRVGAMTLGRAVLSAAPALVSNPVGLAVVGIAAASYGIYKTYKYFTRNDISNDVYGRLKRLRFLMYGYGDDKSENYYKLMELDMLMKDFIEFKNYKVSIKPIDDDTYQKILDLFEVTSDNKDRFNILNNWFIKRYTPSLRAYLQALYSVNNSIYLDDLDKLKSKEIFDMMSRLIIPNIIYSVSEVPFFSNPNIIVTQNQIDELKAFIINEVKDSSNKLKDNTEKYKIKEASIQKSIQQVNESKKQDNIKPVPKPAIDVKKLGTGEGDGKEEPGKGEIPGSKLETKVNTKLNKATGEIQPGTTSLEGIETKLNKEKIFNLDPNVKELFTGMAKEYNTLTGKSINVNEAFRSYDDQLALYKKDPSKAARPGTSTHEYGLAIDINSVDADELEKLGLLRKYGFTRPIGQEKWHLEPIGVSLNASLAKEDENYRYTSILASPGRGGGGYALSPNAIKKKRDASYQLAVYKENNEKIIDLSKVIKNSPIQEMVFNKNQYTNIGSSVNSSASSESKFISPSAKSNDGFISPSASSESNFIKVSAHNNKPIEKTEPNTDLKNSSKLFFGSNNKNMDIAKYANLGPEQAIRQAARMVGINEDVMITYAKMESSLGANTSNKNSSAKGLFQIVDSTWKELITKKGPKYGIPANADVNNNFYNALMAAEYAKDNMAKLTGWKEAGLDEATTMYLAHHYGPLNARKIIKALSENPNTPMSKVISEAAYKYNIIEIGNHTVGSYVRKIQDKMQITKNTVYPVQVTKDNSIDKNNSIPKQTTTTNTTPLYQNKPVQSLFKTATIESKQSIQQPQNNQIFDTKNIESLMTSQLDTLTKIASILVSIDNKFNLDKFKEIAHLIYSNQLPMNNKNTHKQQFTYDKGISSNSINLSSKKQVEV